MRDEVVNSIPHIETVRLLLRPLASTDQEDYTQYIFADAEVMRYRPNANCTASAPNEPSPSSTIIGRNAATAFGRWPIRSRES
jgi:RimJ/RimL family protein N-acetyltransferase